MEVTSFNININSADPEALYAFYRDVVELPENDRSDGFMVAGAQVLIDGHSEVEAPAQEPQRVLVNMFVDDLAAEQARLEAQGVQFIRTRGKEWWGGVISTFLDPDGNYIQLLEFRPG